MLNCKLTKVLRRANANGIKSKSKGKAKGEGMVRRSRESKKAVERTCAHVQRRGKQVPGGAESDRE